MTNVRTFERDEPFAFQDVSGWVVLLDSEMNEVTERHACHFDWELLPGGATFRMTSQHTFNIQGQSVTYMALGGDSNILFLSIIAGHPVEGSSEMTVGR